MKLIITRHGETEANKRGILEGRLPGKLTKEGKAQAKKLALRLKKEKIDVIYSSDLKRAAETAKEIAKYHKNTPLILTENLRENDLGSFEGKRWETIDWKKYDLYKDVEPVKNIRKRAKAILKEVYKNHKGENVLFVGHNAINKQLIGLIMGLRKNEIKKVKQSNTAVSIFELSGNKKHKAHCLNCTKHL